MPTQDVNREGKSPSELSRVLWIFAALGMFVLLIGPSHLLSPTWWRDQEPYDQLALALTIGVGACLGLLAGRDIWRLSERETPRWKLVLSIAVAALATATMIYIRESGIWRWSLVIGDALVVSGSLTVAAVALSAERKNRVRVYFSTRKFIFVHAKPDA